MTNFTTIQARDLKAIDPCQGIILDVRTQMEHDEKHIGLGHTHVPLDQLNPDDFMMRHGLDHDSDVFILCRSGKRAAQAAEKFASADYISVKVIEGGIIACEDCGHAIKGNYAPTNNCTIKPKGPLPLERQVRIVAGAMAATGALFGLLVHPLFTLIPLFVGSGLVFAGITDRCGMALLLTKAPWNKQCSTGTVQKTATACSATSGKIGQSCQ
ncbi:MAG: rhodanese-like domain-containing protein [Micavibrio sp.]